MITWIRSISLVSILIFIFGVIFVYALGTYFMESRFEVDDAAPIADPYTTTGGQSVDVAQVDGSLAIATGKLTVTKQATPVDGDLGLTYETSKGAVIGAATFFKVVFKELNDGDNARADVSLTFGYTDNTTELLESSCYGSVCVTGSQFIGFPSETNVSAHILAKSPVLNDTFYLAVINGGYNEGATGVTTSVPWYTGGGLNLADYNDGKFCYIKHGTGPWLLLYVDPVYSRDSRYPVITDYNSTAEVYDWLTIGDSDSAYYPYMQPLLYQSCTAADGTQLYDDTPEVGNAADSISGNFTITSNATDSDGTGVGIATFECGDDDVVGAILTSLDNSSTGRVASLIFRRNAGTGEYIMIQLNTTTDAMATFSFNGSTFTERATAAVSMTANANFDLLLAGSIVDSTIVAWYTENTEVVTTTYTSGDNTFYSSHSTDHGIRVGTDGTTQIKFIRFYAAGNDGEYAGLSNFFSQASPFGTQVRRKTF